MTPQDWLSANVRPALGSEVAISTIQYRMLVECGVSVSLSTVERLIAGHGYGCRWRSKYKGARYRVALDCVLPEAPAVASHATPGGGWRSQSAGF